MLTSSFTSLQHTANELHQTSHNSRATVRDTKSKTRDICDIIILCFLLSFSVGIKYLLERWRGEVENADGDRKAEQTFHKTFHPLNISVGTEPSQRGQKKKEKKNKKKKRF